MKLEWDLKKHYYKSEKDPQIEKDLKKSERAFKRFVQKYKNSQFTSSASKLLNSLKDYEKLMGLSVSKPAYYFHYRKELSATDKVAAMELNKLEARLTELENSILFYEVALAQIDKAKQKQYLRSNLLSDYREYLRRVFRDARFVLSEPEERVLNLKSMPARSMWIAATDKILNQKTIVHKGKSVPIHGALMGYMDKNKKERHQIYNKAVTVLEEVAPVVESELNALYTDKKINDELRGYTLPYEGTLNSYDQSVESLESLRKLITTEGYDLSRKFYSLKKKWLKKELTFIDRDEGRSKIAKIPFAKAVTICREVFYEVNEKYGKIFDEMLESGQLDVYPRKGKGGGAFCSSGINQPTMVFLNHNDGLDGLRTLAHEMGHAVHAYRSKLQPVLYEGHSIATAETASTFFEGLVMKKLLNKSTGKEKVELLNKHISDNLKTIVMCIARFEIELEFHQKVRQCGLLTWQEMRNIYVYHMKKMSGRAVKVRPIDGMHFVYKPHYRMNFYQYSYSFGSLVSNIMIARYLENETYRSEVDRFLTAGESLSVDGIFKSIGIDTSRIAVLREGLALLEKDIAEFARLIK